MSEAHLFNVAGHAAVGCLSAMASGGKCGPGAASGAAGSFAGPILDDMKLGFGEGLVATSVVGGAASLAGGGKFGDGAVTAAFGYMYNRWGELEDWVEAAYQDPKQLIDPCSRRLIQLSCGGGARGGGGGGAGRNADKSIRSLERRLEEHQKKLDDFRNDPDKFDNKGFLKNAPTPQVRQNIIDGRMRHLQNEIKTFQNQIDTLKGKP
jgi:hypothetical protein